MRLSSFLLIVCFALNMSAAWAQEQGSISGVVTDKNNTPVIGATVLLSNVNDTGIVKAERANERGAFTFKNLVNGTYFITVTSIGFQKFTGSQITLANNQQSVLPAMTLTEMDSQLKVVTVNAKKPFIERKIDRTIVNIDGFIGNAGNNTFDILGRLPGLRVTEEGGINLLGKGATVYIDGRLTYLSGADLPAYLKSLPADQLDKVELIPNPPAKYDAAGSGGIINIITKKNRQLGFNGGVNLNVGQGVYNKLNGSVNFNYRINKINLFSNIGFGAPKDFQSTSGTRRYLDEYHTPYSILDQESFIKYSRKNANVKLGMDYYLSSKTTLGVIFNGVNRSVEERGINENLMYNGSYKLDSTIFSRNNVDSKWKNGTVNLNMVHRFDSTGKELSIDLDYAYYKTHSKQGFENNTYNEGKEWLNRDFLRGDLPRTIKIYSGKVDYSLPLANGLKFDMGLKSSVVKTNNEANYFVAVGSTEAPDYNRTNTFLYEENINAAYLEGYKEFGKLGIKAGVRLEQTNADGHQLGNQNQKDSSFTRHYLSAFPTVFLSYKFDSLNRNQLFFSYGRRISRPAYDQLNPFLSLVQRYYQEVGNPFLSPEYSQTAQLTHVFKDKLTTNVYYTYIENNFSQVIRAEGDAYIKRPENVGNISILGALFSYNLDVTKWWNMDFTFNPERIHLNTAFNGVPVDTSYIANSFNYYNRFSFNGGWSGELAFDWGGRTFSGQSVTKGIAALRAGIKKQIFHNKGSIGLNVSDMFYSAIRKGSIVNVSQSDASYVTRGDSRAFMLAFNYRFAKNNNQNKKPRERNGARDEQGRVK
jgi:outer membrane receptor protein involved in Fe transport